MLAVPALLLLVGLTLHEGIVRNEVHGAADGEEVVWSGGDLLPDPGTTFEIVDDETVALEEGSLLLVAPGLATVRAGPWQVHVWGGSVHVTVRRDRVTVATFETPVLVDGASGTAVIEPYSQWHAPDALPEPSDDPVSWLDAQQRVQPLPAHFRKEQERRIAERASPSAVEPKDTVSVTADLLAAASTPDVARMALTARPSPELAAAIRSRPMLRAYAPLHPAVRDVVWAYAPATPDDALWAGLLLLPRLERSTTGVTSPLTARKWGEALRATIDASSASGTLRTAVLSALEPDIRQLADNGYPLRALRFAEALRDAVGTGTLLTADAKSARAYLSSLTPDALRASVLAKTSGDTFVEALSVISSSDTAVVQPDPALEQRARDALTARNGMITKHTTIRTVGVGTVEVTGVIVGFPSGDRALHFEYTVDADRVRAIVNGAVQPYELTLEQYLAWEAGR